MQQRQVPAADELQGQRAGEAMPPVDRMILLPDFDFWAERVLTDIAWAYYRSAADQEKCEGASGSIATFFALLS